jgi:hypothetical protein
MLGRREILDGGRLISMEVDVEPEKHNRDRRLPNAAVLWIESVLT